MELDVVELSRLQFAMTAMYHFLFVPLTLGLSIIRGDHGDGLCDDEPTRVAADDEILGHALRINFVLGVATGITMEFQFRHETGATTAITSATSSARRWPSRA